MMGQYFAYDYAGEPFVLFSGPHFAALLALLVLNIWLLSFRKAPEAVRGRVRWTMAVVLWVNESLWHAWNLYHGQWAASYMLPLHLCSALIWLSGVALVTKSRWLNEFIYLMGISAAFQYLMTPDLGRYGFPHFRYFQTYLSHGLLLTTGVYLTVVEGLHPTWKSILRVFVIMNIYMAIIYPLNRLVGGNYLLINNKPDTASLLDLLPAWPIYILYMEAIGLLSCVLLYLPFIRQDIRLARQARHG